MIMLGIIFGENEIPMKMHKKWHQVVRTRIRSLIDMYVEFVEIFGFLKTVNSLDEIFESVSVYPDGDVKVEF